MQEPIKPKKVLGQYFLKNTTAIMQSINALRLKEGEVVIEIGPGTGALTGPLAKQCVREGCSLIAVEKDELLAAAIQLPNTQVVVGDVLAELPKITASLKNYKIIGNIPYYITGALLRTISELPNKPTVTVLMIQKEVAQRICSKPGRPLGDISFLSRAKKNTTKGSMNLLAAATQVWATPKLLLILKPSDFEPQPAVYSAVIELTTLKTIPTPEELATYYSALHRIFKQPRKMLINNLIAPPLEGDAGGKKLKREEAEKLLTELKIPLTARPQDLTIELLISLSRGLR